MGEQELWGSDFSFGDKIVPPAEQLVGCTVEKKVEAGGMKNLVGYFCKNGTDSSSIFFLSLINQ
jgi:hypothetical protein